MGTWNVPATVLAHSRFAVSPMAEVVGALGHLMPRGTPSTGPSSRPTATRSRRCSTSTPGGVRVLERRWRTGLARRLPGASRHRSRPHLRRGARRLSKRWGTSGFVPTCASSRAGRCPRPHPTRGHGIRRRAARVGLDAHASSPTGRAGSGSCAPTSWRARRGSRPTAGPACFKDLGRDREWLGDGQLRINRGDLPHARARRRRAALLRPGALATRAGSAGTCPTGMPSTTR